MPYTAMENEQKKQPWKAIDMNYRIEQVKIDQATRGPTRFQVPEGQVVLKGGTGTAPLDAVSWKKVLYDTKDEEEEKS